MSPATVEQVLGTGNLANLSPSQRVELMLSVCRSRGLNPLTRPFRFLSFQGQVVMYATRDCGDQLRKIDGVNVEIAHKGIEDDLYVVEVRATDKSGRHDTDLGAVQIGSLKGEARANAIMRAITKAKRRVTLSISGLGLLDETEALGLPGAKPLDDDVIEGHAEPPVSDARARINAEIPLQQGQVGANPKPTVSQYLDALELAFRDAGTIGEVNKIIGSERTQAAMARLQGDAKARLDGIIAAAIAAHAPVEHPDPEADDGWPGPTPEDVRREREAAEV
jgi:hypothetical protein